MLNSYLIFYVVLNISRKEMVCWGVIWCFMIELFYYKSYSEKSFSLTKTYRYCGFKNRFKNASNGCNN